VEFEGGGGESAYDYQRIGQGKYRRLMKSKTGGDSEGGDRHFSLLLIGREEEEEI